MTPAISLCHRELVRFVRQPHRVIGALATPIVFWLLIGGGMNRSFRADVPGGGNYLQYFFPGTVLMVVLFTAIFSTISVIEDRKEGFLQGVLVAPVSRMQIVLGKVLGGTVLAFVQGCFVLGLGAASGAVRAMDSRTATMAGAVAMLAILLMAFAFTALGLCIAWRMNSTQAFHAIMNLFLMPMWFLSGALFPVDGAWRGLQWVMLVNPLTYGLAALRRSIHWNDPAAAAGAAGLPGLWTSLAVSLLFAMIMFALASWIAAGRNRADLE